MITLNSEDSHAEMLGGIGLSSSEAHAGAAAKSGHGVFRGLSCHGSFANQTLFEEPGRRCTTDLHGVAYAS
jgi:hypothetical protein